MLLAKSLRKFLGISLVMLTVGCAPTAGTPGVVTAVPSLPPPTPTTLPVQNTPAPVATARLSMAQPLPKSGGVYSLAFSPDGKTLISQTDQGIVVLWDVATGRAIDLLTGFGDFAEGMALSSDGKLLATGSCGKRDSIAGCGQFEITLWDLATRQPIGQPILLPFAGATTPDELFSPDGKTLVTMQSGTTGSGLVQLFDVTTRQSLWSPLGGEVQFTSMAFSRDGYFMALGSTAGTIYLWTPGDHSVTSELTGQTGLVRSMAFSPDSRTLASVIFDPGEAQPAVVVLWDVGNSRSIGEPFRIQDAAGNMIDPFSVAFSPDGKTLAFTGGPQGKSGDIVLLDVATRQLIGQPFIGQGATGASAATMRIAFSPDGKILASGTDDGTITLWNLATSSHSP